MAVMVLRSSVDKQRCLILIRTCLLAVCTCAGDHAAVLLIFCFGSPACENPMRVIWYTTESTLALNYRGGYSDDDGEDFRQFTVEINRNTDPEFGSTGFH